MSKFFETNAGKVTAIAGTAVALGVAVYVLMGLMGGSEAQLNSRDRVFICSETGKAFNYTLKIGDTIPVMSPYSGKNTGYAAERCYWTKDGKPTEKPTFVQLKRSGGRIEATFCPDCGRLVVPNNPPAGDFTAPPTEAEYKANNK